MKKSKEEWREILSPEEFYVCREKGTERAFTGIYWDSKDKGLYRCKCCQAELFDSETKFDSGTGWPSFFKPINEHCIKYEEDDSLGMRRVEVLCSACNCHLGHVFEDGPKETGKRYCINSASLDLEKKN